MAIVHTLTSSIFRPFMEPIALESRTPPLAYSKTRPRGPYCRSGLLLNLEPYKICNSYMLLLNMLVNLYTISVRDLAQPLNRCLWIGGLTFKYLLWSLW